MFHNFGEFVSHVKDFDPSEIYRLADRERRDVEEYLRLHCRGKGARNELCGAAREFHKLLGPFMYFALDGKRPAGVHDWDLLRMRPAIESLVRRGFLEQATLRVFAEISVA